LTSHVDRGYLGFFSGKRAYEAKVTDREKYEKKQPSRKSLLLYAIQL
jgi:hypothetical protein